MAKFRGFVKLKKSEKNSEVGGYVKLQLEFLFFLKYCVFCVVFFVVHVSKKKLNRRVGGVWIIRVFLGLFEFV